MGSFGERIRPAVNDELQAAIHAEVSGSDTDSFRHLERAHVLGQASTVQHVRVHLAMLRWALRRRAHREAAGQVLRIVGAATKTAFGWIPAGNTGGSNVRATKSMPIAAELQALLDRAHGRDVR